MFYNKIILELRIHNAFFFFSSFLERSVYKFNQSLYFLKHCMFILLNITNVIMCLFVFFFFIVFIFFLFFVLVFTIRFFFLIIICRIVWRVYLYPREKIIFFFVLYLLTTIMNQIIAVALLFNNLKDVFYLEKINYTNS